MIPIFNTMAIRNKLAEKQIEKMFSRPPALIRPVPFHRQQTVVTTQQQFFPQSLLSSVEMIAWQKQGFNKVNPVTLIDKLIENVGPETSSYRTDRDRYYHDVGWGDGGENTNLSFVFSSFEQFNSMLELLEKADEVGLLMETLDENYTIGDIQHREFGSTSETYSHLFPNIDIQTQMRGERRRRSWDEDYPVLNPGEVEPDIKYEISYPK